MRVVLLSALALLAACGSKPASVVIDTEGPVVHVLDPLPLPAVQVLDAEGAPITPAPAVVWSVEPAEAARIEGGQLVPLLDGTVTVQAHLGELSAAWSVEVSLPDSIVIAGPAGLRLLPEGASSQLEAAVLADGQVIEGHGISWEGGDPAVASIDATGLVTAHGAGTTAFTARSGDLVTSLEVQVLPAEPPAEEPVVAQP